MTLGVYAIGTGVFSCLGGHEFAAIFRGFCMRATLLWMSRNPPVHTLMETWKEVQKMLEDWLTFDDVVPQYRYLFKELWGPNYDRMPKNCPDILIDIDLAGLYYFCYHSMDQRSCDYAQWNYTKCQIISRWLQKITTLRGTEYTRIGYPQGEEDDKTFLHVENIRSVFEAAYEACSFVVVM